MKTALCAMTAFEAAEALDQGRLIIVPLGSQEPHGPQTPMGDYRLVETLAEELAKRVSGVVAPVIPFGHATYFDNARGGISLSVECLSLLLYEVLDNLVAAGARNLLLLNGHVGNASIVANQTRLLRKRTGVIVPSVNVWANFGQPVWDRAQPELGLTAKGHGAEPIGSISSFLHPEDCLPPPDFIDGDTKLNVFNLSVTGLHRASHSGLDVELPIFAEDLSPSAKINPSQVPFSAAAGQIFFEDALVRITTFASHYYPQSHHPG